MVLCIIVMSRIRSFVSHRSSLYKVYACIVYYVQLVLNKVRVTSID